jgi:Carboxyl transferase domain
LHETLHPMHAQVDWSIKGGYIMTAVLFVLKQVMAANGVSHQVVADDLEGVRAVLQWLSFVPPVVGGPLPTLPSRDPADRPVTVSPAQGGHRMLCGPARLLGVSLQARKGALRS